MRVTVKIFTILFVCCLAAPISAFAEDTTFILEEVEMLLQAGSADPSDPPREATCVCKGNCGSASACNNAECKYEHFDPITRKVTSGSLPCSANCDCPGSMNTPTGILLLKSGCKQERFDVAVDPPTYSYKHPSCQVGGFCGYSANCGDPVNRQQNVTGTCISCN